MINRMKTELRRFARDTTAGLSVEAVVIFPLLVWAYGGMYVFWDAFKAKNLNLKAAYTISDMVSREVTPIDDAYVGSMHSMLVHLNHDKYPARIRVSVVSNGLESDGVTERMELEWSDVHGEDAMAPYIEFVEPFKAHTSIDSIRDHIPLMAVGEELIVVETELDYRPLFSFNAYPVEPRVFTNTIVTRPRFVAQVNWSDGAGS